MYLENTLRRFFTQNFKNTEEYSSEVSSVSTNKEIILETAISNDASIVSIVRVPDRIQLSCYFEPNAIKSTSRIKCANAHCPLYANQPAFESISLMYNNYGIAYSQDDKFDICGKNFEIFEIETNNMEVGKVKYAYQRDNEISFNTDKIDMYAYGGIYKFGDHPALIEQQVFHVAKDGQKVFAKISKISDWANKGIDPTKSQFLRNGINKQMNFCDTIDKHQKMNMANLISTGYFQIKITSDFGNSYFKSRYFRHIDYTNFLDVMFVRH